MSYSVGELARITGVSIRTLHHYDEIGLLSPGARSPRGYRLYDDDDAARLQRILFYRALGFDLSKIATILSTSDDDPHRHLLEQRALLVERIEQLGRMVTSVDRLLEARKMGINLTPDELTEVFGDFRPDDHAEEAEQRWGHTDAFKESARRTARYGKQEWQRIGDEARSISARLADAMSSGIASTDATAMDLAEQHRQHITRWFYDCSHEIHCGLAAMYIADPRFTAHYEEQAHGLAAYLHAAILANAERAAV